MDMMESLPAALLDVVVLAGGDSVELMPLTATETKSMLSVCNRPLIWYCLQPWVNAGFRTFFLCVNENNLALRSYLAREFGGVEFHFILVPPRVNDHASTTCDAVKAFLTYKNALRTGAELGPDHTEFDNVDHICLNHGHALGSHRMSAHGSSFYHHNSSSGNFNSNNNNNNSSSGGGSSVNSGRDALREERAARAGLRRDCVLLSCDTILAGVNIRRFVSLHYGSFASVSAMMFRPNHVLSAANASASTAAAAAAASSSATGGSHGSRGGGGAQKSAAHFNKAGSHAAATSALGANHSSSSHVVCYSPDYRYVAVGYEEDEESGGAAAGGVPSWHSASLALAESALSSANAGGVSSPSYGSSFMTAAAAAVGESGSAALSLAVPPSPSALVMMPSPALPGYVGGSIGASNHGSGSSVHASRMGAMMYGAAAAGAAAGMSHSNPPGTNTKGGSSSAAPTLHHCRLHYMSPLSDKPEVRITMAFAARRPQLTFAADVVDAHVYLVRDWVLDFIAAAAGDAEASISHTIVPLLARSQHTTVNLGQHVVITPEQKVKHAIPLHWMYEGRDVNISRLNALSADPLPCKADDLRVFCTIVDETANSACKIYRVNSRANYQAIQSEILAAKCFLLGLDGTSDSTGVATAERVLRERSSTTVAAATMSQTNSTINNSGGIGSSSSNELLRVPLPITSNMVGLTAAAPSPNVAVTTAKSTIKGGGSRLTASTSLVPAAVVYPSRLAIAQLHPDNPFTLRESMGSLRIYIVNSFIDSTVPPNVYITNSVIGKNVTLGVGARISDSVVMENVEIGAKAVVTRSIICSSAIVNEGKHVINSTVAPRCIVENDEQDNVVE